MPQGRGGRAAAMSHLRALNLFGSWRTNLSFNILDSSQTLDFISNVMCTYNYSFKPCFVLKTAYIFLLPLGITEDLSFFFFGNS